MRLASYSNQTNYTYVFEKKKTTTAGGDKTHNIAQFHTPKEDGNLLDDLENKKQSML